MLQIDEKFLNELLVYLSNSVPTNHTVGAVLEMMKKLKQLQTVEKKDKKQKN